MRQPPVRVQGLGFRVQSSGFRVQGSGFRVQGVGLRVQGSGCGIPDLRFTVYGLPPVRTRVLRAQGEGFSPRAATGVV